MNRIPIHALVATALLAWAPASPAQERATIGVGVDLVNAAAVLFEAPDSFAAHPAALSIYVPINLPSFRIEPSIGFRTQSVDGGPLTDGSFSRVELGVGLFVPVRTYQAFTAMAGGRLQLAFNKAKPVGGTSSTANDIYVAAALAGEWAANAHFSVGAEAQLGYYNNGNLDTAGVPSTDGFRTAGLIFTRFFF